MPENLKRCRVKCRPLFIPFFLLFSLFFFSTALMAQSGKYKGPAFKAQLMNIEAAANTNFTYNTTLHNGASVSKIYDLSAKVPMGWNVAFQVAGSQVTSLSIDSNQLQSITVSVTPPSVAKPGKYIVPVVATSGTDSFRLNLEAVVKGTYGIELTTPTGRLSDDVTEGSEKEIHLIVKNTGSIPLDGVDISAQTPPQWQSSFSPLKITHLDPGQSMDIKATLTVPDKTIAGDYVTTFSAKNANANADASFRITVKTSVLTGWIGILVILIALGAVYFLIRKYGRR